MPVTVCACKAYLPADGRLLQHKGRESSDDIAVRPAMARNGASWVPCHMQGAFIVKGVTSQQCTAANLQPPCGRS